MFVMRAAEGHAVHRAAQQIDHQREAVALVAVVGAAERHQRRRTRGSVVGAPVVVDGEAGLQ